MESGNFFYSSLLCLSVQCGTNHSAVFCHMRAVITFSITRCKTNVKPLAATVSYFVSHWKGTVQSITKVTRPLLSLGCGTRLGSGLASMRKAQTAVSCTSAPLWFGNISRRLPIAAATCCTRTQWSYMCIEIHELIRKHESYTLARNTCHTVYIFMQFLPHLVR